MRHAKTVKKFGREKGQRRAFMKGLANHLISHEKIVTTEARAKALRGFVERMVTHAKKQNITSLRLIMRALPKVNAYKLYHEIAPRYADRKGGYTRVIKMAKPRKHDASAMATIEFV
ncbi:MAG: 50S ribosomal protein L17 [Candidatus Paceibacterota bacterium]|jgi:large subunit ribosomal protein L17